MWTSAARGDGNVWEGDLTDIDGQHAYWINTSSTKAFEAVLIQPGIGSASRPPSILAHRGWNLIPVTDLDQAEEGEKQPNYFSSLSMQTTSWWRTLTTRGPAVGIVLGRCQKAPLRMATG